MKKKIMMIFAGIFVLFPREVKADIDFLSAFQDEVASFTESTNNLIKQYTGLQFNLQDLSLNRNILNQLKEKTESALKARVAEFGNQVKTELKGMALEYINTKMDGFSLPGIAGKINMGDYVTPALKGAIAVQYVKKADMENDVQNTVALDIRNNNMRVENVAVMYANALVNRRRLANKMAGKPDEGETDDDTSSLEQIPLLEDRYAKISRDADHRWVNIISSASLYQGLKSETLITQKPVDNLTDVLGEEPPAEGGLGLLPAGGKTLSFDDFKSAYQNVKSGNISGVLNSASGVAGSLGMSEGNLNTLTKITAGATTATNVYNNVKTGNYSGALTSAAGDIGGAVGGKAGDLISGTAGYAGGALNSAVNGDYIGVLSSAGNGIGNGLGGKTEQYIGYATGGVTGALYAGKNGNTGGALAALGSNAGSIFTESGKGTTGNILSSVASGAGSTYNAAVSGDTGAFITAAGAGVSSGMAAGGKNTSASIISNATTGAAAAASSGNADNIAIGLGAGASQAFTAGGRDDIAALTGSAGQTLGSGLDAFGSGGNIIEAGINAAENDELKNNAQGTYDAFNKLRTDKNNNKEGEK